MKELNRKTKETDIKCFLEVNGSGKYNIETKIGFFNHMLETFSKHSGIDLNLDCNGDIEVDFHHTVEDCGIVLGTLLNKQIFPLHNKERFGNSSIVMDESLVNCSIDLSNRSFFLLDLKHTTGSIGNFDIELVDEFFNALCTNFKISCHIHLVVGSNKHHIIEGCFKSFAVALRRALQENKLYNIPSTKGELG